MKKILIGIVIILVLVLTGVTIVKGLQVGNIKILVILEIKNEN